MSVACFCCLCNFSHSSYLAIQHAQFSFTFLITCYNGWLDFLSFIWNRKAAFTKGNSLLHSAIHLFGVTTNLFMFETFREMIACTKCMENRKIFPNETYLMKCKHSDYITTESEILLVKVFASQHTVRRWFQYRKIILLLIYLVHQMAFENFEMYKI